MLLFLWIFIQIMIESLPISSSSHVQLMQKLLDFFGVSYDALSHASTIDFLLHGPTILIVVIYFYKVWHSLIFEQTGLRRASFYEYMMPLALFVGIADFMTISFWFFNIAHTYYVQQYFLPIGLCITACCLWISKKQFSYKVVAWSLSDAIVLGVVQGLSLMPGISRFASTYAAGLFLGYGRLQSFAISFLIQLPLLCAAFAKGLFVLYGAPDLQVMLMSWSVWYSILLASLLSYELFCLVAMLITQNRLWYFAYYMIVPVIMSIVL